MHEWLLRLTRPEDHLLWAWVAIAAGHAVVGLIQGRIQGRLLGARRSSQ